MCALVSAATRANAWSSSTASRLVPATGSAESDTRLPRPLGERHIRPHAARATPGRSRPGPQVGTDMRRSSTTLRTGMSRQAHRLISNGSAAQEICGICTRARYCLPNPRHNPPALHPQSCRPAVAPWTPYWIRPRCTATIPRCTATIEEQITHIVEFYPYSAMRSAAYGDAECRTDAFVAAYHALGRLPESSAWRSPWRHIRRMSLAREQSPITIDSGMSLGAACPRDRSNAARAIRIEVTRRHL